MGRLEGFPMHHVGAILIVLVVGDPHLAEGIERGEDGPSYPRGILPFWWCRYLYFIKCIKRARERYGEVRTERGEDKCDFLSGYLDFNFFWCQTLHFMQQTVSKTREEC